MKVSYSEFDNNKPLILIGGVNVIESKNFIFDVCGVYKEICDKLGIKLIFKASYDKANRSSIDSFRGIGFEQGLDALNSVRKEYNLSVITDVHEPWQVDHVCDSVDFIQLPAFLARQTDLVEKMAKSGKPVNIKKPQFISPSQMRNVIDKFRAFGNEELLICERGTLHGYDNLVVDMLGFGVMKNECGGLPLVFDVTHALQTRDSNSKSSGGRRSQVLDLALAGIATRIASLFLECHPAPETAKCDGPSALSLGQLEPFLEQVKIMDDTVKNMPLLDIN